MPNYMSTPWTQRAGLARKAKPKPEYQGGFLVDGPDGKPRPASGDEVLANTLAPLTPPPDPAFEAQKAAANRTLRLGDAYDVYQSGRVNSAFGNLDNPAGDLTGNPYSRAADLENAYLRAKRGSVNSYAAQGQLYAGSLQNRVEEDRRGYDQSLDSLKKAKQDALDQILKGGLDRYSQVGADITDDQLSMILRALGA